MKTRINYLYIIIAAALWGCIAVFYKVLSAAGLTAMQAVAVRVVLAAIIYTVWLAFREPSAFRIKLKHLPIFLGTGLVSLIFFNWCYFNAISLSSMAVAAVLLYTAPIFVTLLSAIIFKDRLTPRVVAALALAFCGCVLVTGALGGGGSLSVKAVLFGLGSGLGYALYTIFGKIALKHYSSSTVTLYTFIVGAVCVLPIAGLGGLAAVRISWRVGGAAVCLALVCCVLPYIFYTKGLENVPPARASIMATLEPVVASIISFCAYGEPVTAVKIIGIALVLGAVAALNLKSPEREKARLR